MIYFRIPNKSTKFITLKQNSTALPTIFCFVLKSMYDMIDYLTMVYHTNLDLSFFMIIKIWFFTFNFLSVKVV